MWNLLKKAVADAEKPTPISHQLGSSDTASLELLQRIFERAPVGMAIADRDCRILRANKAFCSIVGYTSEELSQLRIVDIVYPDDLQRDLALTEKLFRQEVDRFEMEKHYVRKDGSRVLAHLTCTAIADSSGCPAFRLAVVKDITEERAAEEWKEKRVEEFHRQAELLDLAHDAILVRDLQGSTIVYWNRGAEEIYGWSKLEALGKCSHDLLQTRFPRPLPEIESELRQRGRWEGEIIHTTRHSRTLVMASRWALQRDRRGEPAAILEINSDITREKEAKENANRLAEHLHQLMDATGDGIFGVDIQGRCTFVNPAGAALLGYQPEEIIGKNVHSLAHHTRRDGSPYPESECSIQRAFRAGRSVKLADELLWRKDGTPVNTEYSCYPVTEGGETTGAVMVFRVCAEPANDERRSLGDSRLNSLAGQSMLRN